MSTVFTSWLWPDRVIGKRASGMLRAEHNALVNAHAALVDAAQIIDRETGVTELVCVLKRCHGMFQQSPLNDDNDWVNGQLARDIRAVLARHAKAANVEGSK